MYIIKLTKIQVNKGKTLLYMNGRMYYGGPDSQSHQISEGSGGNRIGRKGCAMRLEEGHDREIREILAIG